MTVRKLIEALKALPQDAKVLVPGYEAGAEDVTDVRLIAVEDRDCPHRPSYLGRYAMARGNSEPFTAVYISGDHDPL